LEFKVTMMCRVLTVSRSGFYAWLKRPVSQRDRRRALVGLAVESAYVEFKKRYGAPRLTVELNAQGIPCSLNHVAALLQERGLRARNGKGFRYCPRPEAMTNVNDNLLGRRFEASAPNQKWVSDITYIKVGRVWLYLAAVLDLFSRKIVGWALDTHMRESLILEALGMAVASRQIKRGTLIHSDRGVQYRGNEYQEALKSHGLRCSMSRKGNCWDNAVMESFFSRLKVELIYAENYRSVEEARSGIFDYIEVFHNRKRRHSAIGYVSPHEYEQQFTQLTVSTFCG
jgi:transposase InsO family protein